MASLTLSQGFTQERHYTHHGAPSTKLPHPCSSTPILCSPELSPASTQSAHISKSPSSPQRLTAQGTWVPRLQGQWVLCGHPHHQPVCVSAGERRVLPCEKSELCTWAGWLRYSAPRITCPSNAPAPVSLFRHLSMALGKERAKLGVRVAENISRVFGQRVPGVCAGSDVV